PPPPPPYPHPLRPGLINPNPKLFPKRVAPTAAALDGQNGFGFVIGTRAMAEAISLARKSGIGIASARRSTHFGMAASYVLQALDAGFVSLVFTNASRAMPPWGGREALLGTSPLAAGRPGRQARAFRPRHVARGRRARQDPAGREARRENSPRLRARRPRAADHRPHGGPPRR